MGHQVGIQWFNLILTLSVLQDCSLLPLPSNTGFQLSLCYLLPVLLTDWLYIRDSMIPSSGLINLLEWLTELRDTLMDYMTVHVCMISHFSCVWLFETLWTVTHQALLSMGFSRQEYCWSGLPCPPPGGGGGGFFPTQGLNLCLMSPALACWFFTTTATWEAWRDDQFIVKGYNSVTARWETGKKCGKGCHSPHLSMCSLI